MTIAITVAVFGVVALAVIFFLARRMLRLAVRLALAGLLVLILIAGALFWWWPRSDSSERNSNRLAAPARRSTNSSR